MRLAALLLAGALLVSGCADSPLPPPSEPAVAPSAPAPVAPDPDPAPSNPPPAPSEPAPAPSEPVSPSPAAFDRTAPVSAEVEAAVRAATLRVEGVVCGRLMLGTGFLISGRTVVTNRHVLDGASEVFIEDESGELIPSSGVLATASDDLAAIRLDSPRSPALELMSEARVGTAVLTAGFPSGGDMTVSRGRVVGIAPPQMYGTDRPVVVTDAPIARGNSGGPLVDGAGRLLGVVFAYDSETGGALAVLSEDLASAVSSGEFAPVSPSC